MLKVLNVIFVCWTPQDSFVLAAEHPNWILVDSETQETSLGDVLVENWMIDGRWLEVYYTHPLVGNQNLWCYAKEYSHD